MCHVYYCIRDICCFRDKEKTERIVKSLGLKLSARELTHTNVRQRLQHVLAQWLPLSKATLGKLSISTLSRLTSFLMRVPYSRH